MINTTEDENNVVLGFFDYEYEDDDEYDFRRALQTYFINKYKIAF